LAVASAERDLRQHIGRGDPDLGGGLMQQRRVFAYIRALFDEF